MPFRRRRGIFGGTAALVNEWGIGVTGDVMFPAETALKQGRRPEQRSMDEAAMRFLAEETRETAVTGKGGVAMRDEGPVGVAIADAPDDSTCGKPSWLDSAVRC